MHGYFVNMHLYRKAKSALDPNAVILDKKKKIKEKVEQERASRVQLHVIASFP